MSSDVHDEIKSKLDIVEFISEYVVLKRAGQNYKGLCPFHPEKTPSFTVSPAKQRYHCFGCGASGDVFGFVESHDNLTPSEALKFLAGKAGVMLRPGRERGVREELAAIHKEAVGFYASCLGKSESAISYLQKRGLTPETIDAFRLGYAPGGWHRLYEHLKGRGYADKLLTQSGLVASGAKGPYDIFRERVMFPIANPQGDVIAFGGRAMGDAAPKYLNSPDTPLFKKSATLYALERAKEEIRKTKEALIVEGYMDAIMCHQHDIRNVVAPLGTALTELHIGELARRFECGITMLFDGDAAGKAAARRSLELILNRGAGADIRVSFLLLPEGEDPASLLLSKGGEHFRGLLSGAGSMVDFMLKTSQGKGHNAGGSNAARLNETIALIEKVRDPVLKDTLILELSEKSGIRERSIRERLTKSRYAERAAPPGKSIGGASSGAQPYDEELLLLSAIVNMPEKAPGIISRVEPGDIRDELIFGIFKRLLEALAAAGRIPDDPSLIAETEAEKALIHRLLFQPGFDPEMADRNIGDCLKRLALRRLEAGIKETERAGDLKRLDSLLKERKRIMQEVR